MVSAKNSFIESVLFQNAYQAGVNTRNKFFPVFSEIKADNYLFKLRFYNLISENKKFYINGVSSETHLKIIEDIIRVLSIEYGEYLHENHLRFGVGQKIINLYLKFLWCIGKIQAPPHCPIDFVVKRSLLKEDKTLILQNWTEMDRDGYIVYLKAFERLGISNIAEWELTCWNQNNRYL